MVRAKCRYLIFNVSWKDGKVDRSVGEPTLLQTLRDSLQETFGEYVLARAYGSIRLLAYDPLSGALVLRCSREDHRRLWLAATLVTMIQARVVALRLIRVTGSLESARDSARKAAGVGGARATAEEAQGPASAECTADPSGAFLASVEAME